MSTSSIRQRITYQSLKQLCWVGVGLAGCSGISSYYYYKTQYLPEQERREARRVALIPKRRTVQYIAGTRDGSGLLSDEDDYKYNGNMVYRLVFYAYVCYRGLLLVVFAVPLLWMHLLVRLHLCPQKVLYVKLRQLFSMMGPSYIKLGQWMATRPDFFPPELCEVLELLFDSTKPHSWRHTEKILRQTYPIQLEDGDQNKNDKRVSGKNALYFLSEIEKVPINSGSIAQVHRARLRDDMDGVPSGTELAIKVTHPNIRRQIKADLLAMETVICIGNKIIPGLKFLNLDKSVLEFSSLLRSQLNLLVECDNFQQFRYNFRDIKGILFPTPLPSLCSQDVLFETFEEGEPLQNIACSSDNTDLAELGCHMFLKMLFQDNFVHSDLHPGNVLIRENWSLEEDLGNRRSILDPKRKERMNDMRDEKSLTERYYPDGRRKLRRELVVLDAGLVTTLSPQERNNFISLFAAVACGDGKLGADLMIDRLPETMRQDDDDHRDKNNNNKGASTNTVDREAFRKSMTEVFDLVAPTKEGFKLSQIRIGYVLSKILKVVREHNAPLDGNFASLVLTVMVGEGLGRKLTPDFNIFAEAAPYMIAYLQDEELMFLANKMHKTYGSALLRDSVEMVKPERTYTYIEVAGHRAKQSLKHLMEYIPFLSTEKEDETKNAA